MRVITIKVVAWKDNAFEIKQSIRKFGDIATDDTRTYIFFVSCANYKKLAGLVALLNRKVDSNEVLKYTVY